MSSESKNTTRKPRPQHCRIETRYDPVEDEWTAILTVDHKYICTYYAADHEDAHDTGMDMMRRARKGQY